MSTIPTREEVLRTIDGFRTAMLTTVTTAGVLHSRPMFVAAREDNVLWFATTLDSEAVDEVRAFKHANVTFQANLVYVSVSGPASIVRERLKIEQLWRESWSAWFPNGPHDPDLVLICVEGGSADMWDMRGAKGLKSAFRALTTMVARRLDRSDDVRAHVPL